ncbi:MAG TPA: Uma2 family endonuclease [Thermoanaerobaculia bacterium]|jgi:Uma2 family endonuclease|nr:Uma2 family endonuclease [Thermoanaerobaculia bacterium]
MNQFVENPDSREIVPLTVEQYHGMLAAGILAEGEPIELLDGLLVLRSRGEGRTTHPQHALAVSKLTMLLVAAVAGTRCHVRVQSPVTLPPRDEPEPDLAIIMGLPADFADRHPGPADVTCVIEVAGASLERDRTVKQRIYAAADIPQYVIVNLVQSRVEVFEKPDSAKGRYLWRAEIAGGKEVALLLPENRRLPVAVVDCLP